VGLGSPSWRRRAGRQDLGDQFGPELVAFDRDVAQELDLATEHLRDHGAAVELEPHRGCQLGGARGGGDDGDQLGPELAALVLGVAQELKRLADGCGRPDAHLPHADWVTKTWRCISISWDFQLRPVWELAKPRRALAGMLHAVVPR